MLQDIWNSISWIGVPGALFVVFIIFCLVKGGNNNGNGNNGNNYTNNNSTPTNTNNSNNNNNAQL